MVSVWWMLASMAVGFALGAYWIVDLYFDRRSKDEKEDRKDG